MRQHGLKQYSKQTCKLRERLDLVTNSKVESKSTEKFSYTRPSTQYYLCQFPTSTKSGMHQKGNREILPANHVQQLMKDNKFESAVRETRRIGRRVELILEFMIDIATMFFAFFSHKATVFYFCSIMPLRYSFCSTKCHH